MHPLRLCFVPWHDDEPLLSLLLVYGSRTFQAQLAPKHDENAQMCTLLGVFQVMGGSQESQTAVSARRKRCHLSDGSCL